MKILFRGESIYEDDLYIVGNYTNKAKICGVVADGHFIQEDNSMEFFEIKENSRSINFEDMLDSQGNKIFASLSESGKGGDILHWHNQTDEPDCNDSTVKYEYMALRCFNEDLYNLDLDSMIAIGIQK